jgi:hypothetical protein
MRPFRCAPLPAGHRLHDLSCVERHDLVWRFVSHYYGLNLDSTMWPEKDPRVDHGSERSTAVSKKIASV